MNPQRITEWLFNSGFLKTTGGVFLGSSASLLIAFQQMEHKIELSTIETNKRIDALEVRIMNDKASIISYVDSNHKLIELQYQYIVENIREIKDQVKRK